MRKYESNYIMSPRRLGACCANVVKTNVAPRPPECYAHNLFNHARHGFFIPALRRSVIQPGKSLEDYDANRRLLWRTFASRHKTERAILHELLETAWRRLLGKR